MRARPVLLTVLLAGCAGPADGSRSIAELDLATPSGSATVAPTGALATVPAPAPSASAPSPPGRPTKTDPARFGCVETSCASRTETCCYASDVPVCALSVPRTRPPQAIGSLADQIDACNAAVAHTKLSLTGIAQCDESSDCADDHVCCEDFLWSGAVVSQCVPLPADGSTPCDYGEPCFDDSTCRVPGSQCIDHECQKPVASVRCDKQTCPTSAPICCSDPPGCTTADKCPGFARIHCTTNGDCLKGQTCADHKGSTACTRVLLETGSDPLCTRDSDCKTTCTSGGRPRCVTTTIGWLKSCECRR